jgi:hypothetical protein
VNLRDRAPTLLLGSCGEQRLRGSGVLGPWCWKDCSICPCRGVGKAGISTIQTGIFPENEASLALHETCGFKVVGRKGDWSVQQFMYTQLTASRSREPSDMSICTLADAARFRQDAVRKLLG